MFIGYNFTMDINIIIGELNKTLQEKQPEKISSSWIVQNVPRAYRYIHKNIRTETGGIDWTKLRVFWKEIFKNVG